VERQFSNQSPKKGGRNPTRPGEVKIEFYRRDAFKVTITGRFDGPDRSSAK